MTSTSFTSSLNPVLLLQELVSSGDLDEALSFIEQNYNSNDFEQNIYHSVIYLTKGDYDASLKCSIEAHDLSKTNSHEGQHQCSHVAIGYALLKLGKLDEALYYINMAEIWFTTNYVEGSDASSFWFRTLYQVKGGIEARSGNIEKALASFERCLELSLLLGLKGFLAGVYNNLGYANNLIGKYEIAYNYYKQSLEAAEGLKNDYQKYYPLSNIGIYYYNKGDIILAEKHHEQALRIALKIGNKANVASQYREMSQIYKFKGDLEKAREYLQRSLSLREEIGNPIWLTFTLIYLIEICLDQGEANLGNEYLRQLQQIMKEHPTNKLVKQITIMGEAFILKGQPRIKPKSEAMNLFKKIIDDEMVDHDTTVNAILHLCELLIFEIQLTNEEDVLIEVHSLTAKLIQIAEANNSHILIGEVLGLQASINIIEGNYELALKLYDEALIIAGDYNSIHLEKKLKLLKDQFISESEIWGTLGRENKHLLQRIQKSNIESYLKEIIKMKDNLSQK